MTRFLPTRYLAVPAIVMAVLVAAGFVFQAEGQTARAPKIAIVVDTSEGPAPALVERAAATLRRTEAATGADGQLRVTRTPTEQLSVTHYLAAQGYDVVVGVGLDRALAVDPVASRFPDTRFASASASGLARAVDAAAR